MSKLGRLLFVQCCLIVTVFALGSGCSQKVPLSSVHGKVNFQGAPLSGALVSFHPENSKTANITPPTGFTKEDGTFNLTTGEIEGAAPGNYVITILCSVPVKSANTGMSFGDGGETEDRLKGAYANRDASQIKVTIKDGPNQLEPFDLK